MNRLEDILFLYGSNDSYESIDFKKTKEKCFGNDVYVSNTGCRVLIGTEQELKHISISCKERLPSYNEIKKARYELCKEVENMAQIFPKLDEYVNLHEFTLHLWEIKERKE